VKRACTDSEHHIDKERLFINFNLLFCKSICQINLLKKKIVSLSIITSCFPNAEILGYTLCVYVCVYARARMYECIYVEKNNATFSSLIIVSTTKYFK